LKEGTMKEGLSAAFPTRAALGVGPTVALFDQFPRNNRTAFFCTASDFSSKLCEIRFV